jgi:hypothetical protein
MGQQAIDMVRRTATTQPLGLGERDQLLQLMYKEPGFIGRYLRLFAPMTQVPPEFHVAVALAAIAAAAENRISFQAYQRRFFPNIYSLLVAGSGTLRKTYTISLMLDILAEAVPTSVLPASFSAESLEDILEKRPAGLLVYSEFGHLLKKLSGRDYLTGVKELLTDLFDNPQERRFQYRGRQGVIKNPAPTILGASTLPWLETNIKETDTVGGFMTRFLIWTGKDAGPPVPSSTPNQPSSQHLVDDLKQIAAATGEADFSAIRVLTDQIVQRYEADIGARGIDPNLEGMYARIGIYTFKLATLFMLSRTLGADLQVIDEDVLRAVATLRYCHTQMERLPLAYTESARDLRRLADLITARPGVTRREVLTNTSWRLKDLDPLINTLVARGFRRDVGKAGGQEQHKYWPP